MLLQRFHEYWRAPPSLSILTMLIFYNVSAILPRDSFVDLEA